MQRTSGRKPSIRNRGLKIGRIDIEAPEDPSGDDPQMLAGELGVGRDGSRGREVKIALERKAQRAARGGEF